MPWLNIDPGELLRLMVDEARSFRDVARLFGVSRLTVARRARELGIESTHEDQAA